MTLPIPGGWGLTILTSVLEVAASLLVTWTFAESRGLGDEFLDGLRSLPRMFWDLSWLAVRPGGDRA